MSNLSDIGFHTKTAKEFGELITKVAHEGERIPTEKGSYIKFSDPSGAELYCQVNKKNEILGMNPHFRGKSKFPVALTSKVERSESAMDGAFHCWAAPTDKNDPESGAYPFIFDLPDYHTISSVSFPHYTDIQLTGFAQQELEIFPTESAFNEKQDEGLSFAAQSFVPIGLFSNNEESDSSGAYGMLNAIIIECELKKNQMTGNYFYWILAETLGGNIDIVLDPKLIQQNPTKGGVISGQFWLSGRVIS